jgi:hypothetical protein
MQAIARASSANEGPSSPWTLMIRPGIREVSRNSPPRSSRRRRDSTPRPLTSIVRTKPDDAADRTRRYAYADLPVSKRGDSPGHHDSAFHQRREKRPRSSSRPGGLSRALSNPCTAKELIDRPTFGHAPRRRSDPLEGMIAIVEFMAFGARIARTTLRLATSARARSMTLHAMRDPRQQDVGIIL